jgi:hypothetical protein
VCSVGIKLQQFHFIRLVILGTSTGRSNKNKGIHSGPFGKVGQQNELRISTAFFYAFLFMEET